MSPHWLDIKLAFRMMVRYPMLTLVSCLAISVGIPVALAPLQLVHGLNASLPFEDGDRLVGFDYDYVIGLPERNPNLRDFERWQSTLTSVGELGAASIRTENVVGDRGLTEIVRGGEVAGSFLDLPRVRPIHGRLLTSADQLPGSAPVAVIAFDLWQTFFNGAPEVIGQTLRFGKTHRTIVGVMPEGFFYPYREHFWVPLQTPVADAHFGRERRFIVLGRLKAGVSNDEAQTELMAVDRSATLTGEATGPQPRPRLVPAAQGITDLHPPTTASGLSLLYLFGFLLVGVTCGNVATLTMARGATRATEIAVRQALGADRSRIVSQLFVESLLLSLISAGLGLGILALAASRAEVMLERFPYWFDAGVQPFTVVAAAALASFSAVVAGVLPALKLTRSPAYVTLQRQAAGATVRFGMAATLLIVLEVGIAVGGLSGVAAVARGAFVNPSLGEGLVPQRYLTAEVRTLVPGSGLSQSDLAARMHRLQSEIERRLTAEGEVEALSFAGRLPGMDHPRGFVDIEGAETSSGVTNGRPHEIRWTAVDDHFFATFEQPILAGRSFAARDLTARPRPVIVNRSFVDQMFPGGNPLGRRIRFASAQGQPARPWQEIVGVVHDLGVNVADPSESAGVYQLADYGQMFPANLVARIRGDALAFAPRLRTILTSIDPEIGMEDPVRLDLVVNDKLWEARLGGVGFGALAAIALILSAAGLYALMSFSVTQRTREIAIRVALGASPSSIAAAVLGRAVLQLMVGVSLGTGLGLTIVPEILNKNTQASDWRLMLAAVAFAMIAVGLLACAAPTRRALRIQPLNALKES
jgi:putative ABC transport system permease protein